MPEGGLKAGAGAKAFARYSLSHVVRAQLACEDLRCRYYAGVYLLKHLMLSQQDKYWRSLRHVLGTAQQLNGERLVGREGRRQLCRRADCKFAHPEGHGDTTTTVTNTSNTAACRFGWNCSRLDCWYAQPDGRAIDSSPQQLQVPHANPTPSPRTIAGVKHEEMVGPAMLALLRERFGQGLQALPPKLGAASTPDECRSSVVLLAPAAAQLAAVAQRLEAVLQELRVEAASEVSEVPLLGSTRCHGPPAGLHEVPLLGSTRSPCWAPRGPPAGLHEVPLLGSTRSPCWAPRGPPAGLHEVPPAGLHEVPLLGSTRSPCWAPRGPPAGLHEVPLLGSTRCLLGPGGELLRLLTAGQHVTLAVGGFSEAWAQEGALSGLFGRHGRVLAVRLLRDVGGGGGHSGGAAAAAGSPGGGAGHVGRVTMGSVEEAAAAQAALHGTILPGGGGRLAVSGYQPPPSHKLFRPNALLHLACSCGRPSGLAFAELAGGAAAVEKAVREAGQSSQARPYQGRRRYGGDDGRRGMIHLGGSAWLFASASKASRSVLQLEACQEDRDDPGSPAAALLRDPERLRRALVQRCGAVTKLTVMQEPDPSLRREQRAGVLAARLRSLLQQYGNVTSLDIKPYDSVRHRGSAFVSFETAQECAAACQALDGSTRAAPWLSRQPLKANNDLICRLRLDGRCYAALRGRLAAEVAKLAVSCPGVRVAVKPLDLDATGADGAAGPGGAAAGSGAGGASIKLRGQDVAQVLAAKRALEAATSGRLVRLGDEPPPAAGAAAGVAGAASAAPQSAMLFLLSPPGKALVKQVEAELGGGDACVHIRWDRGLGQLRLYSSREEHLAAAEARLRSALAVRQAALAGGGAAAAADGAAAAATTAVREPLSPARFRVLLDAGGQSWLEGLAERHCLGAAALTFVPLGVVLEGDGGAVAAARAELEQLLAAPPAQQLGEAAAAQEGSGGEEEAQQPQQQQQEEEAEEAPPCPVCFCPAEPPHRLLLCGHTYCRPCAQQLLLAAASGSQLPAACCQEGCGRGVSLRDCLALLGSEEMERVHASALRAHVGRHPERYGCCLTPDCGQVYDKQVAAAAAPGPGGGSDAAARGPLFCYDCCLSSWCTACMVPWHAGQSCAEYQAGRKGDSEFQQWAKKHSKPCPKCRAPIEKREGCNHMTCSRCSAHFCWLCGEGFAEAGSTYDHLVKRHGGIFDAGYGGG
ncbi:hypothetical protein HYH03_010350 [Edaphochlamys debaryana]|uniref:RBR-type E3 ubiquitin transferase n=1 Tax=Edaphochlamys debaryana TaxID=47281 RepID=A0A836BWD1_9CHLO|nr:hypothetical protein HYH03_010350 [Edaphochlamys debaryana]|eukprot:KAG2491350.1 hypothetical protein HYH03_010350 [Edaphochlamys debaryana]